MVPIGEPRPSPFRSALIGTFTAAGLDAGLPGFDLSPLVILLPVPLMLGSTFAEGAEGAQLPCILPAWLIAMALRQATGSATVATTTAGL